VSWLNDTSYSKCMSEEVNRKCLEQDGTQAVEDAYIITRCGRRGLETQLELLVKNFIAKQKIF